MKNQSQTELVSLRKIPVIIAAMKRSEIEGFAPFAVSQVHNASQLENFLAILESNGIRSIYERYGNLREEWRPFGANDQSIESIVSDIFNRYSKDFSFEVDSSLTENFFHSNQITQEQTWDEIGHKGWCFVVIDGVSMHHPHIRNSVQNALLMMDSNRVVIAVVSPFDATRHQVHSALMSLIEEQCGGLMARYRTAFDPKVDILSGDTYSFHRWIHSSMERTRLSIEQLTMEPKKRHKMQSLQPTVAGYRS